MFSRKEGLSALSSRAPLSIPWEGSRLRAFEQLNADQQQALAVQSISPRMEARGLSAVSRAQQSTRSASLRRMKFKISLD